MKIYVASSWRCQFQPWAVQQLRALGHEVYDFRGKGTGWGDEIGCKDCEAAKGGAYPNSGSSEGFRRDMDALKMADACILVTDQWSGIELWRRIPLEL